MPADLISVSLMTKAEQEAAIPADATVSSVAELVNQANVMALEALLGITRRGLEDGRLAPLAGETRVLADAAALTAHRFAEPANLGRVQDAAVQLGIEALSYFARRESAS
jgi:hypothetical protein